jgi:hypothetical protein
MKTIKLSPKKLDALADEYFASVKAQEENPTAFANAEVTREKDTLAGLALRRWAVQMREGRRNNMRRLVHRRKSTRA